MATGYSSNDLTEFDYSVGVVEKQREKMAKLITEVKKMGWFRRLGDSKVPNDKRWIFHWFSLRVSDPDKLVAEIKKFEHFYEAMGEDIEKLKNNEGDADSILDKLYDKLLQFHLYAESQIDEDGSKVLCKLHQNSAAEKYMLENTVRKVENVRNRREIRALKEELRVTSNKVDELTTKLVTAVKTNEDLMVQVKETVKKNTELLQEQQEIKAENALMKTCLEQFIIESTKKQEKYQRSMEEKFDKLLSLNELLIAEQRELRKENEKMKTEAIRKNYPDACF